MTLVAPRLSKSLRLPRPGHTATRPVSSVCIVTPAAFEQPVLALRRLMVHVRDLDTLHDTEQCGGRKRGSRIVRVHVHLERSPVADDEQRIPELLERAFERFLVEILPLDHEDRAVAVLRRLQMDRVDAQRLALNRRVGERLTGGSVNETARDLHQTGPTGIDHSCVSQDVEQLGGAGERNFTAREHRLEEVGRRQPTILLPFALFGHLANHRQHGSLDRALDRPVRRVARPPKGAAEPRGAHIVRLAEHLHETADNLGEDDARVAASAHQGGSGDVLRDRGARLGARALERLDDRPQSEGEIRAGIAIRHRVHVQIVDSPAVCLEVLERTGCEIANSLELHQLLTRSMWTSSAATGIPTIRSSS